MRPSRRWWIFMLAVALAWGGWWCLRGFGPRPDEEGPDGEENPGEGLYAPESPGRVALSEEEVGSNAISCPLPRVMPRTARRSEPSGRGHDPSVRDAGGVAESAQPSGPPEALPQPGEPKPIPGLEDLVIADAPAPGKPSGFERLPGVDDELEPAVGRCGSGAAADIRLGVAGPAGRQAGRCRASFPRGAAEAGRAGGRGPAEARRGLLAGGPVRRGPRAGRGDLARGRARRLASRGPGDAPVPPGPGPQSPADRPDAIGARPRHRAGPAGRSRLAGPGLPGPARRPAGRGAVLARRLPS